MSYNLTMTEEQKQDLLQLVNLAVSAHGMLNIHKLVTSVNTAVGTAQKIEQDVVKSPLLNSAIIQQSEAQTQDSTTQVEEKKI